MVVDTEPVNPSGQGSVYLPSHVLLGHNPTSLVPPPPCQSAPSAALFSAVRPHASGAVVV